MGALPDIREGIPMRVRHGLALLACASACTSKVQPSNPYDPETPSQQQAKAGIRGSIVAPTLPSPKGLDVVLTANNKSVATVQTADDGAFVFVAPLPANYLLRCGPHEPAGRRRRLLRRRSAPSPPTCCWW